MRGKDESGITFNFVLPPILKPLPPTRLQEEKFERLDDRHGKIVRHLWSQDLVGHKVLLFKKNEESNDPKNSKGYRVAPWMIDLGPAR